MNNLGGTEGCSGEFTFCGGFSQSYSDETVSRSVFCSTDSCYTFGDGDKYEKTSVRRVVMDRITPKELMCIALSRKP